MGKYDEFCNQIGALEWQNIINNIAGGVVVFEVHQNMIKTLFSNEGTYKLFGYSKEAFADVLHNDVFEIDYQPDLSDLQAKFYQASMNNESFEHSSRCFRSNGTLMWTYFRVNYLGQKDGHTLYTGLITDRSKARLFEEKSRINEEMYHIAFNQSNVFLLEYDHHSKKIFCSNDDNVDYFKTPAFSNIPESLVDSGWIHERSIEDFYHFYHQIVGGVKTGEAKLKMRASKGNKYVWIQINFTNIFDDDNKPIKAVGVYLNIDDQVNLQSRYLREVKYRQKLMRRSITNLEVNLSNDEVIKIHPETYQVLGLDEKASYSKFIKAMSTFVAPEDKDTFIHTFALENVIDAYHNGEEEIRISFLYYRAKKNGYGWISAHLMFVYNDESNQLIGFFYTNDIDDDKRKTIELTRQARTDPLTGLINRRELERIVSNEIKEIEAGRYGALFMIDVDDFKLINDANGHMAGDETLRFIGQKLKSLFRSNDVVGRFGGDEFMVYMKDVGNEGDLVTKAKLVSEALTTTCLDNLINISCSVGVTFVADNKASFDVIYHQADSAAYKAKKSGKRSYYVYK